MQTKLKQDLQKECKLTQGYSVGAYDKIVEGNQWIRISEGCPNNCVYCGETKINGTGPKYYPIPKIRSNYVKILDMNLIYKPKALEIIKELGSLRFNNKVITYELQCGVDYRYLTPDIAEALKQNRFVRMRFAWDGKYKDAYKMLDTLKIFEDAGYKSNLLQCFMLANHLIPAREYLRKMQSLLHWHVQVSDCWFDNQKKGSVKPIHWTKAEIDLVSSMASDHNVMCRGNGLELRKLK